MTRPGTAAILDCWDRLHDRGILDRAVGLLALFHPDEAPDAIEGWSVGRRDTATLAARAIVLGDAIRATAACPQCGTVAELGFTAADVTAPPASEQAELRLGNRHLRLRPVTTRDLRHAIHADQPVLAIAHACVDGAHVDEEDVPAISAGLQALDPQADIRLALGCHDCGSAWEAPFDVPGYVWSELNGWARRRLDEVHRLASAYGWSERDILALSPARRDFYLAMCAG